MTAQPVGPLLDALGVTIELEDNQRLTEVVVIGKLIDFTDTDHDRASLVISRSSLDWIAQRGLVSGAMHVLDSAGFDDDD